MLLGRLSSSIKNVRIEKILVMEKVSKFQVEVSISALNSVILTKAMTERVTIGINKKNAKITIFAHPVKTEE
jgi:hypothetical protein